MVSPEAKKQAAAYVQETYKISERWTFEIVGLNRSSGRYKNHSANNEALIERIKALALERRRFGYRRIYCLLKRDGYSVNRKKVYRLYRIGRTICRSQKKQEESARKPNCAATSNKTESEMVDGFCIRSAF
jgi:putative transposase